MRCRVGVNSMNLVDACDLDREVLHAFLSRLDSGYVATNPYHNATYADRRCRGLCRRM